MDLFHGTQVGFFSFCSKYHTVLKIREHCLDPVILGPYWQYNYRETEAGKKSLWEDNFQQSVGPFLQKDKTECLIETKENKISI